ncbi:histidine phosphatase family protein [Tengunoibacter tsumagoiensis]|uniref:Alpha-ribazole phosphatase n=1 Tax=Tengunoibacter tsumagoiensis TaxID=2014871 RepID=A0A402A6J0_9CHLR|nr:histidine phosphatase family protein [Tengunoibacter tsumagoiensis]GCE14752.1 alpha-ribazole phosphatase [Tengunoibacter tsumagoiensis]
MRLIIIRHGETIYNATERLTGQRDIPLTPLGEQQALTVGAYLANDQPDAIVSSDLQRARLTAAAIARYHELPVEVDPRLRELSLGRWEGSTFHDVQREEPEQYQLWREDPSTNAPMGGETLLQFRDRVVASLDEWYARYPEGTVIWVAHAGLIGVLICHILAIDLNRRGQFHHDNASLTELRILPPRYSLVRLNETAFLKENINIQLQYKELL